MKCLALNSLWEQCARLALILLLRQLWNNPHVAVQDPVHVSTEDPGQRSQSSDGGPSEPSASSSASMYPLSSRQASLGYRARGDDGPQRYCFMGRPTARVSFPSRRSEYEGFSTGAATMCLLVLAAGSLLPNKLKLPSRVSI